MKRYELTVTGIQCSTCELLLERTLGQGSAVTTVDADADTGTVVVYAVPGVRDRLAESVRALGYEVDE